MQCTFLQVQNLTILAIEVAISLQCGRGVTIQVLYQMVYSLFNNAWSDLIIVKNRMENIEEWLEGEYLLA